MTTYIWKPCCETATTIPGMHAPIAIPEYRGREPTGGKWSLKLALGKGFDPLVIDIRFCPGCGEELCGEPGGGYIPPRKITEEEREAFRRSGLASTRGIMGRDGT